METIWAIKPKMLPAGPLQRKFSDLDYNRTKLIHLSVFHLAMRALVPPRPPAPLHALPPSGLLLVLSARGPVLVWCGVSFSARTPL